MPLLPQEQSHVSFSGRLVPHSGQNFPLIPLLPQVQSHVSSALGSGFLAPHSGQNLPVIFLKPQDGQSHPVGVLAAGSLLTVGFNPENMVLIWGVTVCAAAMPIPSPMISPTTLLPPPAEIAGPMLPIPSA